MYTKTCPPYAWLCLCAYSQRGRACAMSFFQMSKLNFSLSEAGTKAPGKLAIRTTVTIDYSATVTRTNKRMRVCLFDCWFSCFRRNDAATSRMFYIWLLLFSLYCLFSKGVGIIILGPCPSQYTQTSIQLIHHPDSFAYGPIHDHVYIHIYMYVYVYLCVGMYICIWLGVLGQVRPLRQSVTWSPP